MSTSPIYNVQLARLRAICMLWEYGFQGDQLCS
jgi:hypothetical protein